MSSRMGVNKALLRQSEDSPTLIERVIERVRQAKAQEVSIIANVSAPYEFLGLPIVGDDVKGIGPLGGIIGGLRASSCERNLVVACDMPGINPDIIAYMASINGDHDAIVPRWVDRLGRVRLEPLHAIYAHSSLPKLMACVASGNIALHTCLETLAVRYVDEQELAGFAGATNSFRNVNSPADWVNFLEDRS